MDGVFMGKLWKRIGICLVLAALVWCGTVLSDRETLNNGLIRLHVVANSDSEEDQAVKLKVRGAILTNIQELSLIHTSGHTRLRRTSYAVFCM